jgi:Protein of unknown function (DUF2917)
MNERGSSMKENSVNLCIEDSRLSLLRGQVVGLRAANGTRLRVLRGALWVTQEGDRRDVVLRASQDFELERGGATVLHALKPTRLQLEIPRRAALPAVPRWKALGRWVLRRYLEFSMHRALGNGTYRL